MEREQEVPTLTPKQAAVLFFWMVPFLDLSGGVPVLPDFIGFAEKFPTCSAPSHYLEALFVRHVLGRERLRDTRGNASYGYYAEAPRIQIDGFAGTYDVREPISAGLKAVLEKAIRPPPRKYTKRTRH